MSNIINFSDAKESREKKYKRVLATVQVVEVVKGEYAYNIRGSIRNSKILNEALLMASEHILKEMLVYSNDPEYVLELCEDLAVAALEEILGVDYD